MKSSGGIITPEVTRCIKAVIELYINHICTCPDPVISVNVIVFSKQVFNEVFFLCTIITSKSMIFYLLRKCDSSFKKTTAVALFCIFF